MNSDIIDSESLYDLFSINSADYVWSLAEDNVSVDNKISYLKTHISIRDICKWFVEIMYDVNASEIRQHRKNFYN